MTMANSRFKYYRVFWGVACVVLVLDQVTKYLVQHAAAQMNSDVLMHVAPWLSIVFVKNTGAAWGIFSGNGLLLGLLAVVATAAIYLLRRALQIKRLSMQIAFGLMVAGILGNMIDRLLLGYVVDFIDMQILSWRLLVFNIADVGITSGVALYILFSSMDGVRQVRSHAHTPPSA